MSDIRLRVSIKAELATLRRREAVNVRILSGLPFQSCFPAKLVPGLVKRVDATVPRDIQDLLGQEDTHMTQLNEDADYPKDKSLPTEPMRCSSCGTLLGFFSSRSNADLLLRCARCSDEFDITLKEGASKYKRRSKRATPFPKGH